MVIHIEEQYITYSATSLERQGWDRVYGVASMQKRERKEGEKIDGNEKVTCPRCKVTFKRKRASKHVCVGR